MKNSNRFEELMKELKDGLQAENEVKIGRLFSKECTACGGNWYAMVWSGLKRLHEQGFISDEELDDWDKKSDSIGDGTLGFFYLDAIGSQVILRKILKDLE